MALFGCENGDTCTCRYTTEMEHMHEVVDNDDSGNVTLMCKRAVYNLDDVKKCSCCGRHSVGSCFDLTGLVVCSPCIREIGSSLELTDEEGDASGQELGRLLRVRAQREPALLSAIRSEVEARRRRCSLLDTIKRRLVCDIVFLHLPKCSAEEIDAMVPQRIDYPVEWLQRALRSRDLHYFGVLFP